MGGSKEGELREGIAKVGNGDVRVITAIARDSKLEQILVFG